MIISEEERREYLGYFSGEIGEIYGILVLLSHQKTFLREYYSPFKFKEELQDKKIKECTIEELLQAARQKIERDIK